MKVYHYTHLDSWNQVSFNPSGNNRLGLRPIRRIGTKDKEARNVSAIFALLEPQPENWKNNVDFPEIWDFLKDNIGNLLLEVEVDPQQDQVYIVDRGHMEGLLYQDEITIPERYSHATQEEAERAYMQTRITLTDYLQRKEELNYSLPEVIITQDISIDRIKIASEQPLIEEYLDRYQDHRMREVVLNHFKYIPEMQAWYANYEERVRSNQEVLQFRKKEQI